MKAQASCALKSRFFSASLNVLVCTLGSEIFLCLLKGPPSKTHAESDDIKPRTHKRLEHTKVKVPEVADFQNELPLHGFMLEPWK